MSKPISDEATVERTATIAKAYVKAINEGKVASRGAIAAESIAVIGKLEALLGTSYAQHQACANPQIDKSGDVTPYHEVRGAIDTYYAHIDQLTKDNDGHALSPSQQGVAAKASLNMVLHVLKIEQPQAFQPVEPGFQR